LPTLRFRPLPMGISSARAPKDLLDLEEIEVIRRLTAGA
jgi:hypothetical protein